MNWKKAFFFLSIALMIFVGDAFLKVYVHREITPMQFSAPVFPFGGIGVFRDWLGIDFSIIHVMNKGAAWGVFSSAQVYLLYARIAIIAGLLGYLFFSKATTYRKFSLTLIGAGALGNVVDYFIYGHVVDMFYFIFWGHSFAVFNIADSAISCGIALLLIESAQEKWRRSHA